jgi:hypothetical protein
LCFLVLRIPDDGHGLETQWFWELFAMVRILEIPMSCLLHGGSFLGGVSLQYTGRLTLQSGIHAMCFVQMARYTTPMYRAPEMVDTWSNHAITTASDVWALGCIMYTLCYMKHPFEDSAKLRILNGNYAIPPGDLKYSCYHDIIRKYGS